MADEKKPKLSLSEEQFRAATKSLREETDSMDTDPFKGNLPKKMPDRFKKK